MKVIFVHGNSSSSTTFSNLKLDYEYLSLSLLGHDGRMANGYCINSWVGDLKEQLKNHRDYVLLGHSLGGHICLEAVNELKGIKALILMGTPPLKLPLNIEDAFLPNPSIQISLSDEFKKADLEGFFRNNVSTPSILPKLIEDFEQTDKTVRSDLANSLDQFADEVAILRNLNIPCLLLNGAEESIVNLDYLKNLDFTHCTFQLIQGTIHYPHMENPDLFAEVINTFVRKIT